MMKKRMKLSVLVMMTVLQSVTAFAQNQQNEIEWLVKHWPPFIELDKSQGRITGGEMGEKLKLLQQQLPEYRHTNSNMLWNRFWNIVKSGDHVIHCMSFKRPDTLAYTEYSLPWTVVLPNQLIIKRETWKRMGNPDSVSLAELLQNKRFRGMLIRNRSYASDIDRVLAQYEHSANIERAVTDDANNIKKLLAERGDYIIEYPSTVNWLLNTYFPAEKGSLANVPIKEVAPFYLGYLAGPKNEWGKKVIGDINKVLKRLLPSDEYRALYRWSYTEEQLPVILKYHDEVLISAEKKDE